MENRKQDHIDLAFAAQLSGALADTRFTYEPMFGAQSKAVFEPIDFMGHVLKVPMWVSSMTGGTVLAKTINSNLARACREFGMGMGLGSCRILLDNPRHLPDFDMRPIIGPDLPLFANIGIAQLEHMLENGTWNQLIQLVEQLQADGLIIHVNPMQEWLQDEGDTLHVEPVETIRNFQSLTHMKLIVKEVGQGMGPESIRAVLHLPIEAFELAAFGGTNFAKVELARSSAQRQELFTPLAHIGHTADEMLSEINKIVDNEPLVRCKHLIISGGIRSFLDGYYHISRSKLPAVFGQASNFLRYARGEYRELHEFVEHQVNGLKFAKAFLHPKPSE